MALLDGIRAIGKKIINKVNVINTPRRIIRRYARNWADKENALAVGNYDKAGLTYPLRVIGECKANGQEEKLLEAFGRLKRELENLLNKSMGTQEAEIFLIEQYLKTFNSEFGKIKAKMEKIKIDKEVIKQINLIIVEIYKFFDDAINYVIRVEKNLARERYQTTDVRLATDTTEAREIAFTYSWQDDLEKDEHRTFKEINKNLDDIEKNIDKSKELLKNFEKLRDDYKREGKIEERYVYDVVTRIKKSVEIINIFGKKEVEELRKTGLDDTAIKQIENDYLPLIDEVRRKAAIDWDLARSDLQDIGKIHEIRARN